MRPEILHQPEKIMTEQNNEGKPKIIVDSDWKEEAQKEKEELDRQTRDMPPLDKLPDPSVSELIQMIIMQFWRLE